MKAELVAIAIFAKAPVAGAAKTRLIPALGPAGAARLHRRLVQHTVLTAHRAQLGPVTLWCAPDTRHRFFRALTRRHGLERTAQVGRHLGERMHHAFERHCPRGPLLLIGTDCPALTPAHLRHAAEALRDGVDAVFSPAEDGGYVLVGLHRPERRLFENVAWGGAEVMAQTRRQLDATGLAWRELDTLWDVDRPEDLPRLDTLSATWTQHRT